MKDKLDRNNLPRHIAVIMDGNGRWAKKRGAERIFGHKSAIKSVKEVTEACAELGVEFLTLYAFSTENWKRPKLEVDGLMRLLVSSLKKEINTLQENEVKLTAIGNLDNLPRVCQKELKEAMEITKYNTRMQLTLALSYSGRWEIINAVKQVAEKALQGQIALSDIDEEMLSSHLSTKGMPDPELLIRTSGEMRVSNYLLWQIAYTELVMVYQSRERRFGRISEQVNS